VKALTRPPTSDATAATALAVALGVGDGTALADVEAVGVAVGLGEPLGETDVVELAVGVGDGVDDALDAGRGLVVWLFGWLGFWARTLTVSGIVWLSEPPTTATVSVPA
jgi:hypothetical protein